MLQLIHKVPVSRRESRRRGSVGDIVKCVGGYPYFPQVEGGEGEGNGLD